MPEKNPPTRIYLVRHGQVIRRGQGRFLGSTDLGLSRNGRAQVRALSESLKRISLDRAYASDLKRTLSTASLICFDRGIPVIAHPGFREMDMGRWDGKSWSEIRRDDPEADPRFQDLIRFRFPGGEHWAGFRRRVVSALEGVLAHDPGKNILIVAHAGVNRVILARALGLPYRFMFRLEQDYACLNVIEYFPEGAKVKLVNGIFY